MKEEEENELLFKAMHAYSSFPPKVIMEGKITNVAWLSTKNISIIRPNSIGDVKKISWGNARFNFKPILHDLSALSYLESEEIIKEILGYEDKEGIMRMFIDNTHAVFIKFNESIRIQEELLKRHYDLFNLIPMGLAIDKRTI